MSTSEGRSVLTNGPTNPVIEEFTVYSNIHTKENLKEGWNGVIQRGIQLDQSPCSPDPVAKDSATASEEDGDVGPLAKPLATDASGKFTWQCSMMSDMSRNGHGTATVRIVSGNSNTPSTPKLTLSRHSRGLSRRLTTVFHRDSGLSVQHSWRKRNATVRMKNLNNFVSFHNIYYTVPQGYFWQRKPPKVILNNVR